MLFSSPLHRRAPLPSPRSAAQLAALLTALFLTACSSGDADQAAFEPLPDLELSSLETPVRSQVEKALEHWRSHEQRQTPLDERAAAAGQLGRVLHANQLMESAEIAYREARNLAQEQHSWAYLHGALLQDMDRLAEAREPLKRAVELAPGDVVGRLRLARSLLRAGELDAAKTQLQDALALEPESALGLWLAGQLELTSGEASSAILAFSRVLEIQPQASSVHHAVAVAFEKLGDPKRAELARQHAGDGQVLQDDPLYAALDSLAVSSQAHLRRAHRARLQGDAEGALAEHRLAVEAAPQSAEARAALGAMLAQLGKLDEALKEVRNAQRLSGTVPQILANLAGIYRLRGESEDAVPVYQRIMSLEPGNLSAHLGLARALKESGQTDRAIETYRSLMELAPSLTEASSELQTLLAGGRQAQETQAPDALEASTEKPA